MQYKLWNLRSKPDSTSRGCSVDRKLPRDLNANRLKVCHHPDFSELTTICEKFS